MKVVKLANFLAFPQSKFSKMFSDSRPESLAAGGFRLGGIAQNLANLFLHTSPVTLSAPLQLGLHFILNIAHD
jgi:hypothetical protein